MIDPTEILSIASLTVAALALGAYAYGYVIKSKGDRRWHTAGLLFSGLALADLPVVLRHGAEDGGLFAASTLVVLLALATYCQAVTALRGRRSDRRDEAPAERRAAA